VQCSPFVSDEIWRKTINRGVQMNPWHLSQALLANSPLKNTVMQMVMQSSLSTYYKTLVQNGQTGGITSRDIYESDLMLLNRRVQESKREYISYYMLEEDDDDVDRLSAVASMMDVNNRTDKLILAGLALWKGNITEAENLLNGCQTVNGNEDNLCQILNIVAQERASAVSGFSQASITSLQSLAVNESDCGYSQARAWLSQYADEEYPQNIGSGTGVVKRASINQEQLPEIPLISAQPNPSKGTVYIAYHLPEGIDACELEIIDGNGRLLERRLATGKGIEEWNCNDCPSGLYLIRMMAEGIENDETLCFICCYDMVCPTYGGADLQQ
jgi:hypothetical protein